MKLVIAPDSFKESLSAHAAAEAIASGWRQVFADDELCLLPMADGGEGTIDAVLGAVPGERRSALVRNALGQSIVAHWAWLADSTALIEVSAASGLAQIPLAERDALRASSYGSGELIRAALDSGARRIILGLGGSACTDAGSGLLQALGVRLLDSAGNQLLPGGAALARLARIDCTDLDARLASVSLLIAVDVDNPLCGPQGAAKVFAPQKGANAPQVAELDLALQHFAQVTMETLGRDWREFPGAGAAGGIGFAAKAFLQAQFSSGVEQVAQLVGLKEAIQGADLVITGEGCLDEQSLRGKTPLGVARIAKAAGVPVLAVAGTLGAGYEQLYNEGVGAAFSLTPGPISLKEACRDAATLLEARVVDMAKLWQLAQRTG